MTAPTAVTLPKGWKGTDVDIRRIADGLADQAGANEASDGSSSVDLDALRASGAALVADGWAPSEAARKAVQDAAPTLPEPWKLLSSVGLAQLINRTLDTRRSVAIRPQVVGTIPPASDPLTVPAMTAEGAMRPWLDWTLADWRSWERYAETQADGWAKRQDGSRLIADLLEKHKVERVVDLPLAAQNKVRAIVRGFRA